MSRSPSREQRKQVLRSECGDPATWVVSAVKTPRPMTGQDVYEVRSVPCGEQLAIVDTGSWNSFKRWIEGETADDAEIRFHNATLVNQHDTRVTTVILCEEPILRSELTVGVDFVLVRNDVWLLVSSWYPVDVQIMRRVFASGVMGTPTIELHPTVQCVLQVCRHMGDDGITKQTKRNLKWHTDARVGELQVLANGSESTSVFKARMLSRVGKLLNCDSASTTSSMFELVRGLLCRVNDSHGELQQLMLRKDSQLILCICGNSNNKVVGCSNNKEWSTGIIDQDVSVEALEQHLSASPIVETDLRKRRTVSPTQLDVKFTQRVPGTCIQNNDVGMSSRMPCKKRSRGEANSHHSEEHELDSNVIGSMEAEEEHEDDTSRRLRAISVSEEGGEVNDKQQRSSVEMNHAAVDAQFSPISTSDKQPDTTQSENSLACSRPAISPISTAALYTPGMCGLRNLGNTCYMNSALQCLSNIRALREHFKSGQYRREINRENPLGTGGAVAEGYANLMNEMWSGCHRVVSPRKLRNATKAHASMFEGYQQHDAQELLAFLLDSLHEDLNRVHDKPYLEKRESDGGPGEEQIALDSWIDHLKRNDSIIVDLFHGQLRSQVICDSSTCGKLSIAFDPFSFLSVPLEDNQDVSPSMSNNSTSRLIQVLISIRTVDSSSETLARIANSSPTSNSVRLCVSKVDGCDKLLVGIASVPPDARVSALRQLLVSVGIVENSGAHWNWPLLEVYSNRVVGGLINIDRKLSDFERGGLWLFQLFPSVGNETSQQGVHNTVRDQRYPELRLLPEWKATFFENVSRQSSSQYMEKDLVDDGMLAIYTMNWSCASESGSLHNDSIDEYELVGSAPIIVPVIRGWFTVGDLYDMICSRLLIDVPEFQPLVPMHEIAQEAMVLKNVVDFGMGLAWVNLREPRKCIDVNAAKLQDALSNHQPKNTNEQKGIEEKARGSSLARSLNPGLKLKGWSEKHVKGLLNPQGSDIVHIPAARDMCWIIAKRDGAGGDKLNDRVPSKHPLSRHIESQFSAIAEKLLECSTLATVEVDNTMQSPQDTTLTLHKCIAMFTKTERLSEQDRWYCSHCKAHRRAYKKLSISRLPNVLVVHLKRFRYQGYLRSKIDTLVNFPLNGLDLSEFVAGNAESCLYDLHAVVNHFGSLSGGHYTAFARVEGKWVHFDDSVVDSVVQPEEVISSSAYLLFYVRKESVLAAAAASPP